MERERTAGAAAPPVDEVIKRLGGRALMTRLRAEPDPAQRYPPAGAPLRALMGEPLEAPPPPPPPPQRGGGEGGRRPKPPPPRAGRPPPRPLPSARPSA